MAAGAALLTHRHMFKRKRPCGLGVTTGANSELARSRSELTPHKTSVGIVAVAALDQADVDAMTIGSFELSFLGCMASVAKNCLFALEQSASFGRVMRRMACDATHAVSQVHRAQEIHVLQAGFVTLKAALAGLFRRQFGKTNDLRLIASTFDVS